MRPSTRPTTLGESDDRAVEFVDASVGAARRELDLLVDLFEPVVDLFEPFVDLVEPLVDPLVHLREAGAHLGAVGAVEGRS